jgi:hypothetical protein
MLWDTTLTWGDNYVNIYPKCIFNEFAQTFCRWYLKVQMDDQVYMHLQIIKHNLNERVKEYLKWILRNIMTESLLWPIPLNIWLITKCIF